MASTILKPKIKKKFRCYKCNISFKYENSYEFHNKLHELNSDGNNDTTEAPPTKYKCDKCEKEFNTVQNLKSHSFVHSDEKPYQCDICDVRFKQIGNLNSHKKIHKGIAYTCAVCGKNFNKLGNLQVHEKRHTVGGACGLPESVGTNIANLDDDDIRRRNKYKCSDCNKTFLYKCYLTYHQRTHSGIKPFQCSQCPVSFACRSNLRKHFRIHTGEKPYECDICNKGFGQFGSLTCHKRTHVTFKPFRCPQCNLAYGSNEELIVHLRVHGVFKLFECNQCEMKFTEHCHLKSHVKMHSETLKILTKTITILKYDDDVKHKNEEIVQRQPRAVQPQAKLKQTAKRRIEQQNVDRQENNDNIQPENKTKCQQKVKAKVKKRKKLKKRKKRKRVIKKREHPVDDDLLEDKVNSDNLLLIKSESNLANDNEPVPLKELTTEPEIKSESEDNNYDNGSINDDSCDYQNNINSCNNNDDDKDNDTDNNKVFDPIIDITIIKNETLKFESDDENYANNAIINQHNINMCKNNLTELIDSKKYNLLDSEFIKIKLNKMDLPISLDQITNINSAMSIKLKALNENTYLINPVVVVDKQMQPKKQIAVESGLVKTQFKNGLKLFNCTQCAKVFRHKASVLRHAVIHLKSFLCSICNIDFKCKKMYRQHFKECNKIKRKQMHICLHAECNKEFKHKEQLYRHASKHIEYRIFECDLCHKSYKSKPSLLLHIRVYHLSKSLYKCELCLKSFKVKSQFVNHTKLHTAERKYECDTCGKKFKTRGHLYNHKKIHLSADLYKCLYCGRGFKVLGNLKIHEIRHKGMATPGIKLFPCDLCNKQFLFKHKLTYHMRTHTGERPYPCSQCSARFADISNLHKHFRIHTGVKPFKCTTCFKYFNQQSSLNSHKKSHVTYKPFKCEYCFKHFAFEEQLILHLRVHNDFRLFKCRLCDREFEKFCNYKSHRRLHYGKALKMEECEMYTIPAPAAATTITTTTPTTTTTTTTNTIGEEVAFMNSMIGMVSDAANNYII